jgi:cytochrome c oxidase cbb3-type subunit 3/ubiquinol-cytochrome c reductase cytochrome c subunit
MSFRRSIRRASLLFCVSLACACTRDRNHPSSQPPTVEPAKPAVAPETSRAKPGLDSATALKPAVDSATAPKPAVEAPNLVPHGAELYGRICAVCHGANGEGYLADQAPALGQQDFLTSVSDEFLEFAIRYGRSGTTMSAWAFDQAGPLTPEDIRAVIAFMRSWQRQPTRKLDESPLRGDATRGQQIFAKQCETCHGRKASYVRIVNRQLLTRASAGFLRDAIRAGRPPTRMVGFEKTLGDQGVEDVVAYLKSLPSWLVPGEIPGSSRPHPIPLGKVPLNPKGPEPGGFVAYPKMTSVDVIGPAYSRHARMALLDARAPSDYQDGHISGAVSVPYYDPTPYLDGLPKHTWLVCYCGCPHAESGALARQLVAAGFDKVTVLDEGFGVWIEKGYPTQTGMAP